MIILHLSLEHLRRNVVGRPDHCRGALVVSAQDLGDAKVRQLDVALVTDEHVLRLEVAVNDATTVEVLDG